MAVDSERWNGLALVSLALAFPFLVARSQFLTADPTYYVGLAESLAAGHGLTFMGTPATIRPPGLSLLLLPFVAMAGPNVLVAQLVVAAFAPLSLLALLLFLRTLDARAGWVVGALVAIAYPFFSLATEGVRAELPYLAASACVLGLVADGGPRTARGIGTLGLVAVLAATVVLLRTVGAALPAAFLVTWIHRRLRRCPREWTDRALFVGGVAGLVTAACWFGWTASRGSGSYLSSMLMANPHQPDLGGATAASILGRIPGAVAMQITRLGELLTGIGWLLPTWLSPLTVALAAALGVGLWRETRRPNPVVGWYVMGYGAILVLWPFDEGVRFVFPIFPFLLILVWRGAVWLVGRAGARPVALIALAFLGMMALEGRAFTIHSRQELAMGGVWLVLAGSGLFFWATGRAFRVGQWIRVGSLLFFAMYGTLNLRRSVPDAVANLEGRDRSVMAGMRPGVDWLRGNAAPSDGVMAQFASSVYFYTELRAVQLPITGDRRTLVAALRESHATYLLINDDREFPYYRPTEEERFELLRQEVGPERFELAYRFAAGAVYRVR